PIHRGLQIEGGRADSGVRDEVLEIDEQGDAPLGFADLHRGHYGLDRRPSRPVRRHPSIRGSFRDRSEWPGSLVVSPVPRRNTMKDMTQEEARAEALRRWGAAGTIEFHPPRRRRGLRGRLARYACTVGNG